MRSNPVSVGKVTAIAAGATLAAVITGLSLAAISTPSDFDRRFAAVSQKVDQIHRWSSIRQSAISYPQGAVCAGEPDRQLQALRDALTHEAQARKLTLVGLGTGPDRDAPLGQTLIPYLLNLEVRGPYDQVMDYLNKLSTEKPLIFAETVDVASGPIVTLRLKGRVFCSA